MVKTKDNLVGMVFGRLKVLKQVEDHIKPNGKHEAQWLCECSCDEHNQVIVMGQNLKKKNGTKSCGCLREEKRYLPKEALRKYNKYNLNLKDEHGKYGVGYCSNTGNSFYFDMEDYEIIKGFTWYEHFDKQNNYHSVLARNPDTKKVMKMTSIINRVGYDHKDRNPLNNRKYNLRKATAIENSQNHSLRSDNTSNITGVYFNTSSNKWQSYITINKEYVYLGVFEDKEDAIRTRLKAEKEYFGEFAPQRHLFEQYGVQ